MHNCPKVAAKVKSVVGLAEEKVSAFRGPIQYRTYAQAWWFCTAILESSFQMSLHCSLRVGEKRFINKGHAGV